MSITFSIFKRELGSYFATPVAYVFIVIFLLLSGVFTFQLGGFFEAGQADLGAFFSSLPWLYLFLIPAIAMRLWSEELKSGTVELLLTLPVTMAQAVLGKFLAAWAFAGIALALTFPLWITVAYLGDPDHGVILAGYLGGFLMAGGFLAIGGAASAITKNQVIAFVLALMVCLALVLASQPAVLGFVSGWLPLPVVNVLASFSFLVRFEDISKGVLDARDVVYFATLIGFFLFANALAIELRKAS